MQEHSLREENDNAVKITYNILTCTKTGFPCSLGISCKMNLRTFLFFLALRPDSSAVFSGL